LPDTWANVSFDEAAVDAVADGEAVFSAPEGLHPAASRTMNARPGSSIFIDFMEAD
jgi:hypothetical protein